MDARAMGMFIDRLETVEVKAFMSARAQDIRLSSRKKGSNKANMTADVSRLKAEPHVLLLGQSLQNKTSPRSMGRQTEEGPSDRPVNLYNDKTHYP